MHFDNKKKDNLILGEGLRQGLDDTTLATEVKYPINFSQPDKRFVLRLHYNGSNSSLKDYALCQVILKKISQLII